MVHQAAGHQGLRPLLQNFDRKRRFLPVQGTTRPPSLPDFPPGRKGGFPFYEEYESLLFDGSVFPGNLAFVLRDLVAVGPALGELGSGRHIGSDPDVAADNRAVSDPDTPEDIGACVDGHIIAENGMTRDALDQGAVVILAERQSAKGHALIETAVVADNTGFADHHAGAVVYEEVLADGGAGMDVDACARMGHLVDDARDKRHIALVENVGSPGTTTPPNLSNQSL